MSMKLLLGLSLTKIESTTSNSLIHLRELASFFNISAGGEHVRHMQTPNKMMRRTQTNT